MQRAGMNVSCMTPPVSNRYSNKGAIKIAYPKRIGRCSPLSAMPEDLIATNAVGMGRELFAGMRRNALAAEQGACTWL